MEISFLDSTWSYFYKVLSIRRFYFDMNDLFLKLLG